MAGFLSSILVRESVRIVLIYSILTLPPLFLISDGSVRLGYTLALTLLVLPSLAVVLIYLPKVYRLQQDQARLYHNLDLVLKFAQEAIIIVNSQNCILKMNGEAARLTGWSESEAQGRPLLEVYQVLDFQTREPLDDWKTRIQAGSPGDAKVSHLLLEGRHGWGARIYERGGPYRLPRGKTGWILLFTDISDEIALHDRLHHTQKLESIGLLTGGIAHDFNNMLSGIMGAAELIQDSLPSGSSESAMVDIILKTSERAAALTQRLLSFSRKNKGIPVDLDFISVVQEAVGILEHSLDKKIKIRFEHPSGPCTVRGEASQIQSSILNLGVNARDAMPHGGQLFISITKVHLGDSFGRDFRLTAPPGDYCCLTVRDNGKGMDKDIMERLFDPFFTTKPLGEGTGLGLTAVLRCVKELGGALWVHSEPQKGSEFQLLFPEAVPDPHREEDLKESTPELQGKILLVDDEELVLSAMGSMLMSLGLVVIKACSAQEAVDAAVGTPDLALALVDVVMPESGGQEVLRRLKKHNPSLPVILMSGHSRPWEKEKFLHEGAADFLQKPFLRQKLAQTLAPYLTTTGRLDSQG